jgi:hypothetical protein
MSLLQRRDDIEKELYYTNGKLQIAFIENGVQMPWQYMGQTKDLTVSIEVEQYEHQQTETAPTSVDLTIVKDVKGTLTAGVESVSNAIIAKFLLGHETKATQQAGSYDETITVKKGYDYILGDFVNLTNVVVKNSDDDSITYVAGVDYNLDAEAGYITIRHGGNIADDTELHITADYPQVDYSLAEGLTNTMIEAKLRFVTDSAISDADKRIFIFHKATLVPNGELSLKSPDEPSPIPFEFTLTRDETIQGDQLSQVVQVKSIHK